MALPSSKISPIGNYRQQPNQAYITTKPFSGKVFSYTTYVNSNFVTQGTLAANSSFTVANSPAGRVLHANGRFLNTGVNPGVTKYYLGVLDAATGLNGFIDPSDPTFAKYDVNLPAQYDLGAQIIPALGGQGAKLQVGPSLGSVTTIQGDITGNTTLTLTADAKGSTIFNGMPIIGVGVPTTVTTTMPTITLASGTNGLSGATYTISISCTNATGLTLYGTNATFTSVSAGYDARDSVCGQFAMDGSGNTVITTSAVNTNSLVLLTAVHTGATITAADVSCSNGNFTVTATGGAVPATVAVFNFLIVN